MGSKIKPPAKVKAIVNPEDPEDKVFMDKILRLNKKIDDLC